PANLPWCKSAMAKSCLRLADSPNCLWTQEARALIDPRGCKERPPHSYFPNKKPPSNNHSRRLLPKITPLFAMIRLAIEALADRSWMWCKARDHVDNLQSHHA